MVKGVNKTVIEVNNTGSKMFEKIVLYVTPEYGNLSAKQLRKAAGSLVLGFEDRKPSPSLRKRMAKKRKLLVFGLCGFAALVLGVVLLLL